MDKTTKDALTAKRADLTPEALAKRQQINKKIFKFGCLPIAAIMVLLLIFVAIVPKSETSDTSNGGSTAEAAGNFIPGLAPVDVYMNMEKQGFTTEKLFDAEYGNSWISTKQFDGLDCRVSAFSTNTSNVVSVRATAMIDVVNKEPASSQLFIRFVSTLPYEGADPQKAQQWVVNNFDKHQADTVIGGAKLTMLAPSRAVRELLIEKNM